MTPGFWARPSTVSREVAHNVPRSQPYRACTAHTIASGRACQPRRSRKLLDPRLWQYVRSYLAEGCSPEQITGRIRREYPDNMGLHLSTEAIYAALYISYLASRCFVERGARRAASGAQDSSASGPGH